MIPSGGAQYVTLQKYYFSHPQGLFTFFLVTLPRQLKLRLQIGGRLLLIANHLDESL
jgi:hypothetical protein